MKVFFNPTEFNKSVHAARKMAKNLTPNVSNLSDGSEILAEQNRAILEQAENYVKPLQEKFPNTKSMFRYSTARCVDALKNGNYEHAVMFNLKDNRVLAEFIGDSNKCLIGNLEKLAIDGGNIGIMHSHPNNYPLSRPDISVLKKYGINQVIAINHNGEFSLVAKRPEQPVKNSGLKNWFNQKAQEKKKEKAYQNFVLNAAEDSQSQFTDCAQDFMPELIHDTLRTHTPDMGMRYFTNYSNLKK